jgi:glycosyltransferase involved in cell wall biosynthesis
MAEYAKLTKWNLPATRMSRCGPNTTRWFFRLDCGYAIGGGAMFGRSCIVTDVGGNRELVRDGINGFIAKAPTVELLDETLNRAWECRDRWKEMGLLAATDARQFVSPDPGKDFARELSTLAGDGRSSEADE